MQLAKATIRNASILFTLTLYIINHSQAQTNSPYSRYGLGDLVNHSPIFARGMGGISTAISSAKYINADNPASYASLGFDGGKGNGNLLDFEVATEFNSLTLNQQNPLGKYNSKNLIFNYMQLGFQAGKHGNWGFNLALQPYARENYKISTSQRLSINDSALTVYDGSGGSYRAMLGTGYKKGNLSFGINTGYFFGKKTTTTNLKLINDTTEYYESSSNTNTSYGNFFVQGGVIYDIKLSKKETIHIGATYDIQRKLNGLQDVERLVYDNDNATNPNSGIDSIFVIKDNKGTIIKPSTLAIGIVYEKANDITLGIDFATTAWDNYRFYGNTDAVKSDYVIKAGVQWIPAYLSRNYWSNVTYRAGANYGADYIAVSGKALPVYAFTLGLGLPVKNNIRTDNSIVQPVINLALEMGKRGNNAVNLRENFVKLSLGVALSDIWFFRRKFD